MKYSSLGKRINMVRKDRGFTSERISELCGVNANYFRQIESGSKAPSLSLLINICNVLKVSPDYLLADELESTQISDINELEQLWLSASPSKQELASAIIETVLRFDK